MSARKHLAAMLECPPDEVVDRVAALLADLNGSRELVEERARIEAEAQRLWKYVDQNNRLTEPMAFESPDAHPWLDPYFEYE